MLQSQLPERHVRPSGGGIVVLVLDGAVHALDPVVLGAGGVALDALHHGELGQHVVDEGAAAVEHAGEA